MTKTAQGAGTALEHKIGPRGRFVLRFASGEVAVRGVEGDAARVRSLDERSLADLFTIETADDHLELRQIEKFGLGIFGRGHSAELDVEVPHGANVTIDTASADIEARDLSGTKRFRTASGEVSLNRLAGPVDVETVSGEIEVNGLAPVELSAKTVSGDVEVRVPVLRKLDLGSTSGDLSVDAELTGQGPFAIRTISGDAVFVGRSGFRVEAESVTGDLSSDLPGKRESMPGRKVLIVGRPGPTLAFRSVSGDFHVTQPRDAAPKQVEGATMPSADQSLPERPVPLPPPAPPAPMAAPSPAEASETDAARMEVLRELERGDISVAEATDKLGRLDGVLR
jgi:Putative adhesin